MTSYLSFAGGGRGGVEGPWFQFTGALTRSRVDHSRTIGD